MAVQASLMSSSFEQCPSPADQDLTPDTIQQLLLEAETRLREPACPHADDNLDGQVSLTPTVADPSRKPRYENLLTSPNLCETTNLLTHSPCSIPKLSSGPSVEPYVSQKDEVATVDASRMVTEDQRKRSNTIRPVECTEGTDTRAKKVSLTAYLPSP